MQQGEQDRQGWQIPFFTVWGGQAFSLLGSYLVQFALVWHLTIETGSAVVLTYGMLASVLPRVLLGPFAGALVDRLNRRWVMVVSDAAIALVTAILVYLFWSGQIAVWHIYLAAFIRALGGVFQFPAMAASTSLMVPEKHLSRINGVNQALDGVLSILTPPLGALLVSTMPIQNALMIDLVTAAIAIVTLLLIAIPQPDRTATDSLTPLQVVRDVGVGMAYVRRYRGLVILMGVAALINLIIIPAFSLAPLLVTSVYGGGAYHISLLDSAAGIGMLGGGVLLGIWGGFRNRMVTSLVGLIGMGMGILLVGFAPIPLFGLAVAGFLLVGIMSPICNGPIFALMQAHIPPEMQGRVVSLLGAVGSGASPLGLLIAGPLAERVGIPVFYVAGGVVMVALGLGLFFVPALVRLDETMRREREPQQTSGAVTVS